MSITTTRGGYLGLAVVMIGLGLLLGRRRSSGAV